MRLADLIIYTDHLRLRMKLRGIPHELPKKIYLEAKERYSGEYDSKETRNQIRS